MSLFGGALNNLHIPSIGGMKKQFNKVIKLYLLKYLFSSLPGGWTSSSIRTSLIKLNFMICLSCFDDIPLLGMKNSINMFGVNLKFVDCLYHWLKSLYGPKMHLFAPLTCRFYAFLDKSNSPLFAHLIFFIHSKIPTFVTVPWHAMSIFRKTNWYDLPFRFVCSTMFTVAADDLLKEDSCPWTASALRPIIAAATYFHIFQFCC